MRLYVLSEATIEDIQNRIPVLVSKYFKNNSVDAIDIIRDVIEADPTHGKYSEWLIRQYKSGMIRVPEDNENIENALRRFEKVKSRLETKDISHYTPTELYKAIEPFETSARQEKMLGRSGKLVLPPGSRLVIDKSPYQVVEITNPEASETLCSGTKWCTANVETASKYLEISPLYLIYKNNKRFILAHIPPWPGKSGPNDRPSQFMDVYDENIDQITKFKIIDLLEPVTGIGKKNDPRFAHEYARDIIKGRWSEGEEAIKKDPLIANIYARDIIKGRWPEAEEVISKDPRSAYYYARIVIGGRWPEAEEGISKDHIINVAYANDIIKGRWPEAEEIIKIYPDSAYTYALDVIKGRWPEGEEAIKKDSKWSLRYAKDVIKGRWPEGEEAIKKEPHRAFYYAQHIIKGRWPEGEEAIRKDPGLTNAYYMMVYPNVEKYTKNIKIGGVHASSLAKNPRYNRWISELDV